MTFYEKYESLCREEGFNPQSPEMMRMTGVSSGAISGWKGCSLPKTEVIVRIARHFGVSSDYLLGLSKEISGRPLHDYPDLHERKEKSHRCRVIKL